MDINNLNSLDSEQMRDLLGKYQDMTGIRIEDLHGHESGGMSVMPLPVRALDISLESSEQGALGWPVHEVLDVDCQWLRMCMDGAIVL